MPAARLAAPLTVRRPARVEPVARVVWSICITTTASATRTLRFLRFHVPTRCMTMPPVLFRQWLAPVLAVAGLALLFLVFVTAFSYWGMSASASVNALLTGVAWLGVALQVAAIGVSLVGAVRHRRVPVVALLYGLLALGVGANELRESARVQQWYRDTPGAFSLEPDTEARMIHVEDANDEWLVSFDACPGASRDRTAGFGSRQQNGVADVSVGDATYMRLHVRARRIECLSPLSP